MAIQHGWRTASRHPPHFAYEAALRSWLVRVLLDEALAMLHESKRAEDAVPDVVNTVSQSHSTVKPVVG